MAIVVGTDSYISVEDANTYLAMFGLALPADEALAEGLLKRATMAIDRVYGSRFIGVRYSDKPLEWPRISAAYSMNNRYLEDIPNEVAYATAEFALMLDAGFDPYAQPAAAITETSVTVDVISTSEKYAAPRRTDTMYNITVILQPVLKTGGALSLVR